MRVLEFILNQFEKPINYKGSIIPMLDSIKNNLLGRVHYPHTHFIETGSHSITLVTHGTPQVEQSHFQRQRDFIWILEKLVRLTDQLDEQLHAGFYFYILTSPAKFVSNSVFIWPFVCLYAGLCLPIWLD
jgi:Gaa1-like, GPI transamidase component